MYAKKYRDPEPEVISAKVIVGYLQNRGMVRMAAVVGQLAYAADQAAAQADDFYRREQALLHRLWAYEGKPENDRPADFRPPSEASD